MQRIIQRYTEGGGVQPATNTGLPAGGNASSAIANYLLGPMSANATTLSYTGSGEGVPDYHALALEQKKLREAKMIADAAAVSTATVAPSGNGGGNTASVYNQSTDPATIIAQNEEDRLGIDPDRNESTFSGGGSDGVGNFGTFGDYVGGISDAFGFTDYAGTAAKNAADEKASNQNTMSNFSTNYGNEAGGLSTSKPKPKAKNEVEYDYDYYNYDGYNKGGPIGYNMGSMKKPVGYNMGTMNGPIGYNMGGVSQVARTMLPEEQIRQRQMQQAQADSTGGGALAQIGNAMGMKIAGKGVDTALGKMAGSVAMKTAMGSIPVVGPFLAALFG